MKAYYEISFIPGVMAMVHPVIDGRPSQIPIARFMRLFDAEEYVRESYETRGQVARFEQVEFGLWRSQEIEIDAAA